MDTQYSAEYLAEDIGPSIIATSALMITFSTLFVGLRYYARYLSSTKFAAEDILIPFAWVAELGLCITAIIMVKKAGTGRHLEYLLQTDPAKLGQHLRGILVTEFLHSTAVAFPKMTVVILFLRVFRNKHERAIAWVLLGVIAATWVSFFVATGFQCRPFAYAYDKSIPGGRCFNTSAFALSSSIPNAITDLVVIFLPIRTVFELKISMTRRIGLMFIFLTGSVGIVASVIRIFVFARTKLFIDFTYSNVPLMNWTLIEPGLYLLAACGLSFKPLFRMLAKALHLSTVTSHTRSAANKPTQNRMSRHGEIQMKTLKSSTDEGFSRLSGSSTEDEILRSKNCMQYPKGTSGVPMNVVVTRTVEVQTEDLEDGESVRSGDFVGHNADIRRGCS